MPNTHTHVQCHVYRYRHVYVITYCMNHGRKCPKATSQITPTTMAPWMGWCTLEMTETSCSSSGHDTSTKISSKKIERNTQASRYVHVHVHVYTCSSTNAYNNVCTVEAPTKGILPRISFSTTGLSAVAALSYRWQYIQYTCRMQYMHTPPLPLSLTCNMYVHIRTQNGA